MKILLDTHVFIWSVMDSKRLQTGTRALMASADLIYVSAASIWEIAIKARLGKIKADLGALVEAIEESGFLELTVTGRHAAAVAELPLLHSDPFDRLLLAQAISEPLHFLTADKSLQEYSPLVRFA